MDRVSNIFFTKKTVTTISCSSSTLSTILEENIKWGQNHINQNKGPGRLLLQTDCTFKSYCRLICVKVGAYRCLNTSCCRQMCMQVAADRCEYKLLQTGV